MQKNGLPEGLSERLFHTIWQFQYFNLANLTTYSGDPLTIIHQGIYNVNAGPDFLDGRIKIGNTVLAGRIELHLKASDWILHCHERDPHYQNLILHVVFINDKVDLLPHVPVLELCERIPASFLEAASRMLNSNLFPPCKGSLDEEVLNLFPSFAEKLLVQRLQRRSSEILVSFDRCGHDWNAISWSLLCRTLGGPVNAEAFEALAQSLPFKIIRKHAGKVIQLEALLFGQSGLLPDTATDPYPSLLRREYRYLQKLYGLQPSSIPFQFLRMRPGSFPTVRIALLAAIVSEMEIGVEAILEDQKKLLLQLSSVKANDFWHYHYLFSEPGSFLPKKLGAPGAHNLLINWKAPLMFAYGKAYKREELMARALEDLHLLKGEENSMIKKYADNGFVVSTAGLSQAILELKNYYCDLKNCLNCNLGIKILKREPYNTARHFL